MPSPPSKGLGNGPVSIGMLELKVDGGSDPAVVDGVSSEGLTRLGRAVSVSSTATAVEAKLGLCKDGDGERWSVPEGSSRRFSRIP